MTDLTGVGQGTGASLTGDAGNGTTHGPVIHPATGPDTTRSPLRLTMVGILLALVLGAIIGGWAIDAVRSAWGDEPAPPPAVAPVASTVATVPVAAPGPAQPVEPGELSARVAALEERLSRIAIAADSVSGNTARAEGVLVVLAARRAIDRGLGLGAMESQLRLRFGESKPNAVQSILSAAARPVLSEDLLQRLDALHGLLVVDSNAGWLTRIGNSLSNIIVVRSADGPSQLPEQHFQRALRAVQAGRLDLAVTEVEAMPGHDHRLVQDWLDDARRLNDARRALDLLETAAIIEPGDAAVTPSAN